MAEQKVITIKNLGVYGLIRQASVDDSLIPEGAVTEAINVNFDRVGAVQLRAGIVNLGGTVTASGYCYGLFNAVLSSPSVTMPFVAFTKSGSQSLFMYQSGSWSASLTGETGTLKTRFVTFNNYMFRVNGTDNMKVWNGASWETSGGQMNPDDMASYDTKFIEVYKNRVYTAGNADYPNRLYFSSVISSTGLISWTPTVDYVDIWEDGEQLTGIKRYSLELLLFKPNYTYRFKTSGVDADPLIKVGTRSQESIIEGKKGLYFHHETGFYKYSGGYPEDISRPISDIVSAIPYSYHDDISSWKDSDHIYWSIGDLTVDGESWTNIVVRFTESSDLWTVYSYSTEFKFATEYNSGSAITQIAGADDGHVYTINSGTTDDGTAIGYRMITKWYDWDTILDRKLFKKIVGLCEKAQGSKLYYQTDDNPEWTELGQLRAYMTLFDQLNIRFHRIRFKLRGISSQEAFIFQGLVVPEYENEGIKAIGEQ